MENQTNYTNQLSYFDDWFKRLLPYTLILAAYLLLGVLGNVTVLYIYLKRYRSYSGGRFFVPVLAVLDLIACVVNCSAHLFVASSPLNGALTALGCKIMNFACSTTTKVSIYTILIIAFDRYLKICRPTGSQMSRRLKKISIVMTIIIAVACSIPYLKFLDVAVLQIKDGLTIKLCVGSDGTRAEAISYGLALLLVIFIELIILSVLYVRIYIVAFRRPSVRVPAIKMSSPTSEKSSNTENLSIRIDMTIRIEHQKMTEDRVNVISQKDFKASAEHQKMTEDRVNVISQKDFKASVGKVPSSRVTVIFLVITIAFAISYIPKFVIMFLAAFEVDITGGNPDLLLLRFFLRSFYIFNNIINPLIYGYMDKSFQAEVKKMFCSFCFR